MWGARARIEVPGNACGKRCFVQQHQACSGLHEQHDVRIDRRVAERRIGDDCRCLRQHRNAGDFVHPHVPDVCHETERRTELVRAIQRQRNVVRIGTDRTVVVITVDREKDAPLGGKAPEGATRWHRTCELGDSRRSHVGKGNCDRPPRQSKFGRELLFQSTVVVDHGGVSGVRSWSASMAPASGS